MSSQTAPTEGRARSGTQSSTSNSYYTAFAPSPMLRRELGWGSKLRRTFWNNCFCSRYNPGSRCCAQDDKAERI